MGFVDRAASMFGASEDRELRAGLQRMALYNGEVFEWRGAVITGHMALDAWRRSFRRDGGDDHAPFTPEQWRCFNEAMAKVRDPNIPMVGKAHLLRIGEDIERRQSAMRAQA